MVKRALREIGSHPRAGVWVMVQMLLTLCFVAAERDAGPSSLWDVSWWFPPYGVLMFLLMLVIQFPASISVAGVLLPIEAAVLSLLPSPAAPHDPRMAFTILLFAPQWIVAAIANYLIWVYALPAFSRWLDSRWPSERIYFRR